MRLVPVLISSLIAAVNAAEPYSPPLRQNYPDNLLSELPIPPSQMIVALSEPTISCPSILTAISSVGVLLPWFSYETISFVTTNSSCRGFAQTWLDSEC